MGITMTITRTVSFSAGHRVLGDKLCGSPHGHTYQVSVTVQLLDEALPAVLLGVLQAGVVEPCDGAMIVWTGDGELLTAARTWRTVIVDQPPTLSNLALEVVRRVAEPIAAIGMRITRVEITDKPGSTAAWDSL